MLAQTCEVHCRRGRDVVENPERAAVRGDDKVIAMNRQVAHGGMRKIQLQRLPVVAVVKRNVYRSFAAGEKQAFARGIFTHDVDRCVVRQASRDFRPVLTVVARPVDMRMQDHRDGK